MNSVEEAAWQGLNKVNEQRLRKKDKKKHREEQTTTKHKQCEQRE